MTEIMSVIQEAVEDATEAIKLQIEGRSYKAANELRNASLLVLRGQRHGRRYKVPGTFKKQKDPATGKMKNGRYYTASAPGEPPAVRTGVFRMSWQPSAHVVFGSYISRISSDVTTDNGRYNLGEILENGTEKMAPRPHHERIAKKAEPAILRIYDQPYQI
jgi:hypothetical protein